MPSERIQRRIDALLDEADTAVSAGQWMAVAEKARAVLALDGANEDAAAYLKMAEANLGPVSAAPEAAPTPSPPAAASEQPAAFAAGRYQVRKFLGEGGKKKVFLAYDALLDRDVAFALIKTDGLDDVGRERVTREAQAMGRMGAHPHVVSVFDLGEEGGAPYIVTELMGGGDVEGELERAGGALELSRSLDIAKAVARGLAFAHERGVVHRDLKPGNVWLTSEGVAKIGDFGLAVAQGRSRLTQHGLMVGTFGYMPPEQALGGEATPQSDLYSLGAMLYELVTGRPPFQGDSATAVISQHLNAAPVAPSWHTEHCPPALEDLVLALLAKEPASRPASAADVLAVLERIDPAQPSRSHSSDSANPLDRLAHGAFVGRTSELARLRQALDEAIQGHGSIAMLVGEPGIGKTRTVRELETYARMRGAYVFWGRTHESSGAPPYWPWVQVGNAWGAAVDLLGTGGAALSRGLSNVSELSRLFPALRQFPGFTEPEAVADPDAAQFRLFDAYTQLLRNQSQDRPWLVVLDDLHWADAPTLKLLQHVARELPAMRLLVVGTYRDTDIGRQHPLSEALAALNREGGFQRLVLRGLARDEVSAYLQATAGVAAAPALVERIHEETEGNPFFLAEVVNLLVQEGTLSGSVSDIALPDGVKEALGRRLDRLTEDANALLAYAAVAGREFSYETLQLVRAVDDDALLKLLEEALAARVIEETGRAGRYRFTHALMQETLLDELSTTRRVRMHGELGEALERRYGDRADEHAPQLALHYGESATLNAQHAARAVRYSRLAAEQAEAQAAWGEAARQYERCLSLIEAATTNPGADEVALLTAWGRCARVDGDQRTSWQVLLRAIDRSRARGDGRSHARAAVEIGELFARPARQLAIASEALDALKNEEPYLEAQLHASAFGWALSSGAADATAEAHRVRAAELAEAHDFADVQGDLLYSEALVHVMVGDDLQRSREHLGRASELFQRVGAIELAVMAANYAQAVPLYLGALDDGWAAATAQVEYARANGSSIPEQVAASYLGSVHFVRAEYAELEALGAVRAGDRTFFLAAILAGLSELRGDRHRTLESLPAPAAAGTAPLLLLQVHAARARLMWNAGRLQDARHEFETSCEAQQALGVSWRDTTGVRVSAGFVAALDEALPALGDEGLLNAVLAYGRSIYDGRSDPPVFDPISGRSVRRPIASVAAHLGELDDAERWFSAALAWAERERCPVELGRCHQGLAEVAERRGQHAEAMHHLDAAGELFARHGAKPYLDQVIAKKQILRA